MGTAWSEATWSEQRWDSGHPHKTQGSRREVERELSLLSTQAGTVLGVSQPEGRRLLARAPVGQSMFSLYP